MNRSEIARREATRDPVFLFQSRRVQFTRCPDWLEHDGDCFRVSYPTEEYDDLPQDLPLYDEEGLFIDYAAFYRFMLDYSADGDGSPCAIELWETELVFATREEGEAWGRDKSHRYRDGWRVYCVPAAGTLTGALKTLDKVEGR